MKLKLTIDLGNAAFDHDDDTPRFRNGSEIARILRNVASNWNDCAVECGDSIRLHDTNGNHVGEAKITR